LTEEVSLAATFLLLGVATAGATASPSTDVMIDDKLIEMWLLPNVFIELYV